MSFKAGRSAIGLAILLAIVFLVGWTPLLDQISSRVASSFIQRPVRLSGVRFSYLNGFTFARADLLNAEGKGLVTGGPGVLFFVPTTSLKAKIRISADNIFADHAWCSESFSWIKSLWPGQKPEALGPAKLNFEILCSSAGVEMIRVKSFESRGIIIQGGLLFKDDVPVKGNLALYLNPAAKERIPRQFTEWLEKNKMPNGNYKISWTQNQLTVRDKSGPRLKANWQSHT